MEADHVATLKLKDALKKEEMKGAKDGAQTVSASIPPAGKVKDEAFKAEVDAAVQEKAEIVKDTKKILKVKKIDLKKVQTAPKKDVAPKNTTNTLIQAKNTTSNTSSKAQVKTAPANASAKAQAAPKNTTTLTKEAPKNASSSKSIIHLTQQATENKKVEAPKNQSIKAEVKKVEQPKNASLTVKNETKTSVIQKKAEPTKNETKSAVQK